MRSTDAWKDLDILKLPKTKLEIDESTALDDNTFETIAKDEKGTKYQFKIARDEEKRRWVVDDVLIRQKKKGRTSQPFPLYISRKESGKPGRLQEW